MESEIYAYQEQGKVLGFGAIFENEIRAFFPPEYRGKSVGKELLEFLLLNIQGDPCLYVEITNQPAKYLYQRYSFSVTDTFETTYNQILIIVQKMARKASAQNNWSIN